MKDDKHFQLILQMAKKDILALENMKNKEAFADEIFGFHAQQAIEKLFKSILIYNNIEYPKTHDLDYLQNLICDNINDFPTKFRELSDYTDFAVEFRYDALDNYFFDLDRSKIIDNINELLKYIEETIL